MARSKRSVEKELVWRGLVEEQRRSGLSIRKFCQQRQISEPSFYAWRKKLQGRRTGNDEHDDPKQRLIPVVVTNPARDENNCRSNPLEIATPGGFTLRFDQHAEPENIAQLLMVIRQCSGEGAVSC